MATHELSKLAAEIERQTEEDGVHGTAVPALRLCRFSSPTELIPLVYEPCLCIVAQGAKEVVLANEPYHFDRAQSLLVSVALPVAARVTKASLDRPYLAVCLLLDPAVVGELLAEGATIPPVGVPCRGISATRPDPPLLDAAARLVALLNARQDLAALSPLVLREITYRVLTGPQGLQLRQIASAGAPAHRIARAIRWLKDHFAEPLRVLALARRVGMSSSAFHMHFKGLTALSPLQYQKRLRLQEARRLMLGEGIDAASAAFRVGYESPSQFGREYRRLFGESPRRNVTALTAEARPTGLPKSH